MHPVILFRVLFLLVSLLFGATVVRAEDLHVVKTRMEQRQSTVDALKDRQVVGEDNRGFLEARGSLSSAEQKTVSDENADRRTVYEALAKQTGTDANSVGRQRAQQIAIRSKRGVWIQSPSGDWAQKT